MTTEEVNRILGGSLFGKDAIEALIMHGCTIDEATDWISRQRATDGVVVGCGEYAPREKTGSCSSIRATGRICDACLEDEEVSLGYDGPGDVDDEEAIDDMTYPEYPEGLTGESACYACDGPREQVDRELRSIIADCELHADGAPDGWDATSCDLLRDEAQGYLDAQALRDDLISALEDAEDDDWDGHRYELDSDGRAVPACGGADPCTCWVDHHGADTREEWIGYISAALTAARRGDIERAGELIRRAHSTEFEWGDAPATRDALSVLEELEEALDA